jgi:hypothetical protein
MTSSFVSKQLNGREEKEKKSRSRHGVRQRLGEAHNCKEFVGMRAGKGWIFKDGARYGIFSISTIALCSRYYWLHFTQEKTENRRINFPHIKNFKNEQTANANITQAMNYLLRAFHVMPSIKI